jgi:Protein of unknown function (DUF1592)/Protein of unknown function (DUF1588)/Protein of unknown function (DUF1595)/Protein of unknown function (DUF1585)/Protein of unknown function (DUF1587)
MSMRKNLSHRHNLGLRLGLGLVVVGLSAACGKANDDSSNDSPNTSVGGGAGSPGEDDSNAGGGGNSEDGGTGGGAGESNTDGSGGDGGVDREPLEFSLDGAPLLSGFVRLTHPQWYNSMRAIFEVNSLPEDLEAFSPDAVGSTFSNNEKGLVVGETEWSEHQAAAEKIAAWVASDAATIEKLGGLTNATEFIKKVGKRAFRRPLSDDEVTRFEALWSAGSADTEELTLGSPEADGARVFLEALLQSPHFLYRVEMSPNGERLTGLELAAKLSLSLTDTTPSDELLAAAEAGDLDDNEGVLEAAEALLADPGGTEAMVRFHHELYQIDRYPSIDKDVATFPAYSAAFNQSVAQADDLLFGRIYTDGGGLRELLTTSMAYVDAETASFYGQAPPASGFVPVEVEGRPGFLTRLGFLASQSTKVETAPIRRGVFVLRRMLCANLDPPSGTAPVPAPREEGETGREWATRSTSEQPCKTCHHEYINPLGFAFETFDAIGQTRTTDMGKPIDSSGAFPFQTEPGTFADVSEMVQLLAQEPIAHQCYSARLAEYLLARDLHAADEAEVVSTAGASLENNASIGELLLDLVQSPLFTNSHKPS